jgi:hypothetical protein
LQDRLKEAHQPPNVSCDQARVDQGRAMALMLRFVRHYLCACKAWGREYGQPNALPAN